MLYLLCCNCFILLSTACAIFRPLVRFRPLVLYLSTACALILLVLYSSIDQQQALVARFSPSLFGGSRPFTFAQIFLLLSFLVLAVLFSLSLPTFLSPFFLCPSLPSFILFPSIPPCLFYLSSLFFFFVFVLAVSATNFWRIHSILRNHPSFNVCSILHCVLPHLTPAKALSPPPHLSPRSD